jgi:adenylate cyclase
VEMTVVFADLSSFTEMTGRLGAATTYSVVDEFLRLASTTLMSHGAFIDKYIGDAVMALFNVPIKRADHAAAAVAASAKLQELLPELSGRLAISLHASIGIASGFARVGRLGSDDIKDYTAIGDVVNQAARLQAQAGPTEILVSRDVYREVASAYPGVSAETLALKGFPQRTVAYRLRGKPRSVLSAASWTSEDRPGDELGRCDARHPRQRLPRKQHCCRTGACLRWQLGGCALCARTLVRQQPRPRAAPHDVDIDCFYRPGLTRASTPHAP